MIWDNDRNCKAHEAEQNRRLNRRLLKIAGAVETDWPTGVWDTHACLDGNLEMRLRDELSEPVFFRHRDDLLRGFDMSVARGGRKNPYVLRRVVEAAAAEGYESETLNKIISKLVRVLNGHEQ